MTSDKKIWLEIGTGNGDFLFSLAAQNLAVTFVGLEIRNRRFNNMIRRREKLNLHNIILIQGRGEVVLPALFRDNSLEKIFILFPDPWPKRRHAEHRIWNEKFFRTCWEKLKINGELSLATDDAIYATAAQKILDSNQAWKQCEEAGEAFFKTHSPRKRKKLGRKLNTMQYFKGDWDTDRSEDAYSHKVFPDHRTQPSARE